MSSIERFTFAKLMLGLLLFGTVTTMILSFSGNMFTEYGENVDTTEITSAAGNVSNSVTTSLDTTEEEANSIGGSIAANLFFLHPVFNIISVTLSSFGLIDTILFSLSDSIGLPAEFQTLVYGFVVFGIGFALVRIYRGG